MINSGNWIKAQEELQEYFKENGVNPLSYYLLGYAQHKNNKNQDAINNFYKYIEMTKPGDSKFRVSACIELLDIIRHSKNELEIKKALDTMRKIEPEAQKCTDDRVKTFAGIGYSVIFNYGVLVCERNHQVDREKGLLILEGLYQPIAGIQHTTAPALIESYFLRNNNFILDKLKKDKSIAVNAWDRLYAKENLITPVLNEKRLAEYKKLKNIMLAVK